MKVEEQFEDVLQNIESSIVSIYHAHPELADWDVEAALDSLTKVYHAEARHKSAEQGYLNYIVNFIP